MAADPRLYRDPVHAIGSPEDSKATDPTGVSSMIALLKGILAAVSAGGASGSAVLVQPAKGFTIVAVGNTFTFALANDLAAVEALAANGIATRTGADTWVVRTLTGTSGEITITNGDGASGNPTLSLPNALVLTGKTIQDGTFNGAVLNSPTLNTPNVIGTTNQNLYAVLHAQAGGLI